MESSSAAKVLRRLISAHGLLAIAPLVWVGVSRSLGLTTLPSGGGWWNLDVGWSVAASALYWLLPVQAILFTVATCLVPGLWRDRQWWLGGVLILALNNVEIQARQERDFGVPITFYWRAATGWMIYWRPWLINVALALGLGLLVRCVGVRLQVTSCAAMSARVKSIDWRWMLCGVGGLLAITLVEWLDEQWQLSPRRPVAMWGARIDAFVTPRAWLPTTVVLLTAIANLALSRKWLAICVSLIIAVLAIGLAGYCHAQIFDPIDANPTRHQRFCFFWCASTLMLGGAALVTGVSTNMLRCAGWRLQVATPVDVANSSDAIRQNAMQRYEWTTPRRWLAALLAPWAFVVGAELLLPMDVIRTIVLAWCQLLLIGAITLDRNNRTIHVLVLCGVWLVNAATAQYSYRPWSEQSFIDLLLPALTICSLSLSGLRLHRVAERTEQGAIRVSLANILAIIFGVSLYSATLRNHWMNDAQVVHQVCFFIVAVLMLSSDNRVFSGAVFFLGLAAVGLLMYAVQSSPQLEDALRLTHLLVVFVSFHFAPFLFLRAFGYRIRFVTS